MTKKLSEIGTHCTPSPHSYTQYEPYWTFTADERRELVRGSIKRFLVGHMLEWRLKCELSTALDGFCEEQGL